MRGIVLGIALLGLASPVSAGVYNSLEKHPYLPPETVRRYILQLRAIAAEPQGKLDPGSMRAAYEREVKALKKVKADDLFSTQNRVDLAACYLRLGKPHEAISVLSAGEQNHVLVQANLASAYFLANDLDMAIRHQIRALKLWPVVWATWTADQLRNSRACEKVFLRLLMARATLAQLRRIGDVPYEKVFLQRRLEYLKLMFQRDERQSASIDLDPIFDGLNQVVPSKASDYKPGRLDQDVLDQIQSDAYGITLQLAVWYPFDERLFWLLAELLNAYGQPGPAFEIMDGMWTSAAARSYNGLVAHRKVLAPVWRVQKEIQKKNEEGKPPAEWLLTIAAAMPRGTLEPPVVGTIATAATAGLPLKVAQLRNRPPDLPLPGGVEPLAQQPPEAMPFNWRHVTIGFAFGFLVAVLLGFQWQEWRRQWALRQAVDPIIEPTDQPAEKQESESGVKPGAG